MKIEELLRAHVPSFEASGFRHMLRTGEMWPRFDGPWGFTSSMIMQRGSSVSIMDKDGKDHVFPMSKVRKEVA